MKAAVLEAVKKITIRNDVAERDHDRLIQIKQANERGELLGLDDFPKQIFGAQCRY